MPQQGMPSAWPHWGGPPAQANAPGGMPSPMGPGARPMMGAPSPASPPQRLAMGLQSMPGAGGIG